MTTNKRNQRDECIDWCRAIGIILVVIGHSGCPERLDRFIYLFHMALFFFLSGYCYRDRNDAHPIKYLKSKLKSLYLPFIFVNGLFVLLHNTLIRLNIYTTDPLFLTLEYGNGYGNLPVYTAGETLKQLLFTLLFAGNEQMGGATWFLRILFVVCIFHCLTGTMLIRIGREKHRAKICCLTGILFLLIGWLCDRYEIIFPLSLESVFSAYFPFALGVFWKKYLAGILDRMNNWILLAISLLSGLVLYFLSGMHTISLGSNQVVNPLFYGGATILGVLMVYCLAKTAERVFMGKNIACHMVRGTARASLYILFFHFLSFKIVTYGYLLIRNLPSYTLACFPTATNKGFLWVLYTAAGVFVPILIRSAVRFTVEKGFRRRIGPGRGQGRPAS